MYTYNIYFSLISNLIFNFFRLVNSQIYKLPSNVPEYKNLKNIEKKQNDFEVQMTTKKNKGKQFVMVPSLQAIENKIVNLNLQKCPSLQMPVKKIATTEDSVSVIQDKNMKQNHQSVENYNCLKRPFTTKPSQSSIITKPIIERPTVFVPVLKPVNPKQLQAFSDTCMITNNPKLKPNQMQYVQSILNTNDMRQLPIKSTYKFNISGKVAGRFQEMSKNYPNKTLFIRHLLALEKCRLLGDVIHSNDTNIESRNDFHSGFSQYTRLQTDDSDST